VALNARRAWARWVAAAIVMFDVILQVGFFPSMPLLATLLIAIDVVVLFALTVRWEEAKPGGVM
jgi:Na+/H+ antiporter NhaB